MLELIAWLDAAPWDGHGHPYGSPDPGRGRAVRFSRQPFGWGVTLETERGRFVDALAPTLDGACAEALVAFRAGLRGNPAVMQLAEVAKKADS